MTLPPGFKFDLLKTIGDPLPIEGETCFECDEDGVDEYLKNEDGTFLQYEIKDASPVTVCYRVLCVNDVGLKDGQGGKMLGPTGHIERMNVWSHVVSAVAYGLYVIVRPATPMGSVNTVSSSLAVAAFLSFIVTFSCSSFYHTFSANRLGSAMLRLADYLGIYLGIAFGTLSDVSVSVPNLDGAPWQASADIFVAMAVMVGFFVVRRAKLDIDDTRKPYYANKCSLGFARHTNVDLEHSALREAGGVAMAFAWILCIAPAFSSLELDCAWFFCGSRFVGTSILIFGMVFDNVIAYPDAWVHGPKSELPKCACYSSRRGIGGGWICTSHALWHCFALLSTVVTSVGTEYAIANSDILKN